jgi:hypothetical protein
VKDDGTWVAREERLVDAIAEQIVHDTKRLDEAIGDRPFGRNKKAERQQARESSIATREHPGWDDPPAAWAQWLDEVGDLAGREYVDRMVRLRARYPEESRFVSPEGMNG